MSDSAIIRPADPFGPLPSLPFETSFPVVGVPLAVRSNAAATMDLAAASFGAWQGLPDALVGRGPEATLDIVVGPATGEPLPLRLESRRHGAVRLAAGGPLLAAVLTAERRALVFVPGQALDAPEWFATHVCGLAMLAVSGRWRVPLHAAAVVAGDHTLLLTGASGTGKSTMAYACAAAGFSVLGEDTVFVDLSGDTPRLWGYAPQILARTRRRALLPRAGGRAGRDPRGRRDADPCRGGDAVGADPDDSRPGHGGAAGSLVGRSVAHPDRR